MEKRHAVQRSVQHMPWRRASIDEKMVKRFIIQSRQGNQ
jgi:hypothetical protein